jgi:hypothetical protein
MTRKGLIDRASKRPWHEIVLGGGLEPPCLSAYAPQTYVSAIPPPEHLDARLKFPQTVTAGKCRVDSSYCCSRSLLVLVIERSRQREFFAE